MQYKQYEFSVNYKKGHIPYTGCDDGEGIIIHYGVRYSKSMESLKPILDKLEDFKYKLEEEYNEDKIEYYSTARSF